MKVTAIRHLSEKEYIKQKEYSDLCSQILKEKYNKAKAFVHSFGCQGNVSDGEKIKGILETIGYSITDDMEQADFILLNTCAVREHAQDRAFGNAGSLKNLKDKNRNLKIALCGCMVQQQIVIDKIKKSYGFVDLAFGTHVIHRLPELIYKVLSENKKVYEISDNDTVIDEYSPVRRDSYFKAFVPIMYGCNNFCTYCIVPYVRGRERSRKPEDIIREVEHLVSNGYKEVTLLGQNVNSYGNGCDFNCDFSDLLVKLNNIEGDFIIRFMTSHPKDCSFKLLDTMAKCDKVAKHLHLPVQCGNDEILKKMNRGYTAEKYLTLLNYAYSVMPDLSVTTDIIVGFPGETYQQFNDTLELVKKAKYTSMYTFIFSPRPGTVAFNLPDPISREEKGKWFLQLTSLQEEIAEKRTSSSVGKTFKVLCENINKKGNIEGRTEGNIVIEFEGDSSIIGTFKFVKVTQALTWVLKGEII